MVFIGLLFSALSFCFYLTDASTAVVDCSKIQQTATYGSVHLGVTSVLDNGVGPNGYLHVQVTNAGSGWLAWGFSGGGMVPGNAVVGILPGSKPEIYAMTDKYAPNGVAAVSSNQQTLKNHSFVQNGTHSILTFTKRFRESSDLTPIKGNGNNVFLLAWGNDNNFGYHGGNNRQYFPFVLQSCVNGALGSPSTQSITISGSSSHQKLWSAHGFFAATAWGVLAPIAIGASLLRRLFITSDLPALWFKIHMSLNLLVLVFTTLAFSFAVRAISLTADTRHFRDVEHRKTGLIIMIMVFYQSLSGLLRPHLPHPKVMDDEEEAGDDNKEVEQQSEQTAPRKSLMRVAWEIGHRLIGFTLLGFTWWQVQNGLKLYALRFEEKDLSGVFWGITGVLSGIIFIVYVLQFILC